MCRSWVWGLLLAGGFAATLSAADWVVYEGKEGPGKGKHIVLVSGDEEYRSEEALPQLGKILAQRQGFKCTVLFPIDKDGTINPEISNIPGLEALASADLMIVALRFRNLPDEQMQHIDAYLESGKPVMGMRTATHAFNIPKERKYAKYSWGFGGEDYKQGFGKQVLGETWVNHHGAHGKESTRGLIAKGQESNPILRGIKDGDIWGPTDVYTVNLPLPGDSMPLVMGQVLTGMKFDDPPLEAPSDPKKVNKNDPMMPVAWTKTYKGESGKVGRVFTTTMGSANDLLAEGTRRMLVNAALWAVGLEGKIPEKSNVELVGEFQPTNFAFKGAKKGVTPAEHVLK